MDSSCGEREACWRACAPGSEWRSAGVLAYHCQRVVLNAMPAAGGGKGYTHRQDMTVYASTSGGATWFVRERVYAGPVGYSSLGELSTGTTCVASLTSALC